MRKKYLIYILIGFAILGAIIYAKFFAKNKDKIEDLDEEEKIEMIYGDVLKSDDMSKYISYLVERNIMQVNKDNKFNPQKLVTKGELNKIIVHAILNPEIYQDILEDDYIKYAQILEKYYDISEEIKIENLKKPATKLDIAIALARADINIRNKTQNTGMLDISDVSNIDEVSEALLVHSIKEGYFDKVSDKFYPNSSVTRARISKIIYTFLNN